MSKYKDLTGNTQPSSLDENTGALERQSSQSASTDNTQISTENTNHTLPPMLSSDLTTPPTTDKKLQQSLILRAVLSYFLRAGMVKRYRVLSLDGVTVLKIRYEFDMSVWTKELEPK